MAERLPQFTTVGTRTRWTVTRRQGRYLRVITANLAKSVLREQQGKRKFPRAGREYLRIVDRKLGAREESVKFGGRIIYHNNTMNFAEILAWIAHQLVKASPRRTKRGVDKKLGGYRAEHYQDAHLYMVNGRAVQSIDRQTTVVSLTQSFQTTKHTMGSKHQFVNTMPYAKRIESKGVTTIKQGRINNISPWTLQAPSGVYKRVVRAAKRRFGETVNISYTLLPLNLPTNFTMMGAGGARQAQLFPAIVVRPKLATPGVDAA